MGLDDIDLNFGHKTGLILSAAINLFVPLLASEAIDYTDSHTVDSDAVRGLFNVIQLEGLNNRFDLFLYSFPLTVLL